MSFNIKPPRHCECGATATHVVVTTGASTAGSWSCAAHRNAIRGALKEAGVTNPTAVAYNPHRVPGGKALGRTALPTWCHYCWAETSDPDTEAVVEAKLDLCFAAACVGHLANLLLDAVPSRRAKFYPIIGQVCDIEGLMATLKSLKGHAVSACTPFFEINLEAMLAEHLADGCTDACETLDCTMGAAWMTIVTSHHVHFGRLFEVRGEGRDVPTRTKVAATRDMADALDEMMAAEITATLDGRP
jgi:hypothetical protein